MVATTMSTIGKSADKVPVAAAAKHIQSKHKIENSTNMNATVSPTATTEDDVLALRAENKLLREALKAVEKTATEKLTKSFDVVWFARNRCRFPNHEASKRIENADEHKEALERLRGADGDFHFGFHSGLLAASRMFKDHADISYLDLHEEGWHGESHSKLIKHNEKVEESKTSFPNLDVDKFPHEKN